MNITKDNPCNCELRTFLGTCFLRTRNDLHMTQTQFAAELNIDRRSYLDIEHSKNICCVITLLIYLCYHCKNVPAVIDGCREVLDKYLSAEERQI